MCVYALVLSLLLLCAFLNLKPHHERFVAVNFQIFRNRRSELVLCTTFMQQARPAAAAIGSLLHHGQHVTPTFHTHVCMKYVHRM